ncbi:unnamed protein product [Prorocentrum cordatum]|uniref:Beta-galactosidase n=1 Tax=Prorocentrum cordatum TaxID=2364126 RepID=A0ABN9TBW8_9DINO|nr:unnamed protein product [Polarella glacialis]
MRLRHVAVAARGAAAFLIAGGDESDLAPAMETYAPKSCKFNLLPSSLRPRAYTAVAGEARIHGVFGAPPTVERHAAQLDLPTPGLLTAQAEVGSSNGRVLFGENLPVAGGEETKAFLRGQVGDKEMEIALLFELLSAEVGVSQVDALIAETTCWPARVDLTFIPLPRAPLHWPLSRPQQNSMPPPIAPGFGGGQVLTPPDKGLELTPWGDFDRSIWSATVEAPPRIHRFARFYARATYHFASGPLQLALELYDLEDTPDGAALGPKCALGCLGGAPAFNGQVVDRAVPAGFRYRLRPLAASMPEWTAAVPERGRRCTEFDYRSIAFESRVAPFEVGPSARLCEHSRLPGRAVQSPRISADKLADNGEVVSCRGIWVANVEHEVILEVAEACISRATTHHLDGMALRPVAHPVDEAMGEFTGAPRRL